MMKLKHTEVIQLIIGGRARLLSHKIYRHSISCYSVAGRIQLKDLSPCSYPEGTPLEVSVICLSLCCLCRDHCKGIGLPNTFQV